MFGTKEKTERMEEDNENEENEMQETDDIVMTERFASFLFFFMNLI